MTGASSGIGAALTVELASAGVQVMACARRRDRLQELLPTITSAGGAAPTLAVMDVMRADETVAQIKQLDDEVGGLDLIVANAGVGWPQAVSTLDWESSRDLFATNFMGAMATLTAILPRMVERGRGHLVGVSSVAALAPTPNGSAYRASKAGLSAFLDNVRAELGGTGVNVTAIHPGFVRTAIAEKFPMEPPLTLEADAAARLIVRRLRRAPAQINFPWSVVLMMRLMAALPAPIRGALVRRVDLTSGAAPTSKLGADSR